MVRWARVTGAGAAVALALALATACTPEPAPTPTPTGFASAEEAFAAAEATYRAYVDAVNQRRADPKSSPDPTDFLTGAAYNDEIETNDLLAERGWHLVGRSAVASSNGVAANSDGIDMTFCLDATATRVEDESGADVTPADRVDILGVNVSFISVGEGLLISDSSTSTDPC